MADDLISITPDDALSGAESRIKELSNKVKLTSEERDENKRLRDEADTKVAEVSKERDFYSGFADIIASQPAAKDHKEEILTKVKAGYSVEDATAAVLVKAGKYQAPKVERDNPAGGSANITPPQGGNKSLRDMSREEKRAALIEAEKRGDISMS